VDWYLDASIPIDVRRALELVRRDIIHPGQSSCPINEGDKDRDWLPIVGSHQWPVILRDKRIRTRPGEIRALLENDVGAFILSGAGNYTKWETLQLLARKWDSMQEVAEVETRPFIFTVTRDGVRSLRR
jgi:hypothetical protein